jgi:predicted nucleic acid-binding protein
VRFWDTSAIIPLWIAEQGSARAKAWYRTDPDIVVWTLTRVEVLSALARRRRQAPGAASRLLVVRREFIRAWGEWSEVTAIENVRRHAERIVESYPLRAADAMRIGAAIVAAEDDPAGLEFVTFDENLARAAEHEGFRILGLS